MSRTPIVHHRPTVRKGNHTPYWWSKCACGHIEFFSSWKRAFIDALIHSEELK